MSPHHSACCHVCCRQFCKLCQCQVKDSQSVSQSRPVISKYFLFISRPVGLPSLPLSACLPALTWLHFLVQFLFLGLASQASRAAHYATNCPLEPLKRLLSLSPLTHLSPHTSHCKTKRIIDLHWFHFLLDLVVHG